MGLYQYKGVSANGKAASGVIDADSQKTARQKLKQKGIFATEMMEKKAADVKEQKQTLSVTFGKSIKPVDISTMTRQFATLVNANVPIVDTIDALADQVENERLKIILTEVKQKVNEGSTIADGLKPYAKVFSNLYVNMVMAGESSGTLGVVLSRLADYIEKQVQLRNKLIGSMIYPVIMIVMAIGIVGFLFVVVIPRVTSIFESMDKALPIYTEILIAVSNFVANNALIIIITVAISGFLFYRYINTEGGRYRWDGIKLKLPILGKVVRMTSVAQFTRTLATLHGAGVPLLQALEIVRNVVSNTVIKESLDTVKVAVTEGKSLAVTLERTGQFPPIVIHMVSVGEKTGELEGMLKNVSDSYDMEVETKIGTLSSLIEPVMIIFMGIVVSFIVMAILLPILEMSQVS